VNPQINMTSDNNMVYRNSTPYGKNEKAYELNETGGSAAKVINGKLEYLIAIIAIALILLVIGYKRQQKISK